MSGRLFQIASVHTTTYSFRSSAKRVAFGISLLLVPMTVLGSVNFPKNPQTTAECEEPVAEMRAMENSEHELGSQLNHQSNALKAPDGCFADDRCSAAYYDQHHQLHLEITKHFKERDRIHNELRVLENTCRAAAKANEKLADEAKQNEKLSDKTRGKNAAALPKTTRDLKDDYTTIDGTHEDLEFLSENSKDAHNKLLLKKTVEANNELAKDVVESAYVKRNDAHSDTIENAMDQAKETILDPVPKSPIIGTIQDASFDRLKSHVQQLSGDVTEIESAIQSVDSGALPASEKANTGALPRRVGSSGSEMFKQAASQAKQDEKNPGAHEARERLAREQQAAAKAQEEQISQATWNIVGMMGKAALSAVGGQTSTERMQLALNSLAQEAPSSSSSGGTIGETSTAAQAPSSGGAHNDCSPDEGLFQNYVEAQNNYSRAIGRPQPAMSAYRKRFKDIYDQHYHGHSPERLQDMLEFKKKDLAAFKSSTPQAPSIRAGEQVNIQLIKCEIDRQKTLKNPTVQTSNAPGGVQTKEASSDGRLRWPSEGGIEQWVGFKRPSGCAPDLYYIKPLYDAVNSKTGLSVAFSETRNFYESPTVTNFINDPNALTIMQKDMVTVEKIASDALEVANSVTKLSSTTESPSRIIDQIRSLQFENPRCESTASGSRAQYFCGTAVKLLELTHRIEGMVQIACRMRVETPSYQKSEY